MNLNFDSEKEQNNQDNFYDSTHDEDDSSIFDFWIKTHFITLYLYVLTLYFFRKAQDEFIVCQMF